LFSLLEIDFVKDAIPNVMSPYHQYSLFQQLSAFLSILSSCHFQKTAQGIRTDTAIRHTSVTNFNKLLAEEKKRHDVKKILEV